jgi:hypothetical protein
VGSEEGKGWLRSRCDFVDSLMGIFLVAGKKKRVPHAENIRQRASC